MITLTLAAVKEAARKAYDEKRLTAQNPNRPDNNGACVYNGGKLVDDRQCGCAIGVGLPPELFDWFGEFDNRCKNRRNVGLFIDLIFKVDHHDGFCDIQQAHDRWASITHGIRNGDVAKAESEFLRALETA